jgi:hypothetical protein
VFSSKYLSPFIGVRRPVEKSGVLGIYLGKLRVVGGWGMVWEVVKFVDCWV